MGKRTLQATGIVHKPRPRDFWSTIDARCIPPLLAHLQFGARYAEPMAGDGALVRLLGDHAVCVWAADLEPQNASIARGDALACEIGEADMFISNPPWTRSLLHALIVYLSDQAPTWLLFDSDWLNTGQAGRFMDRCRKVVHVGRLIWIPGTTNAGFTSCSWYLFDKPRAGNTPLFYAHGCKPPEADRRVHRICADCGVMIDRFGKWHLQMRQGVPSPVHKDCRFPTGRPQETDVSLLAWGGLVEPAA